MKTAIYLLFGVPAFLVMVVAHSLLYGYALSVLWGWFMVPLFNAPPLSIAAAIGVATIVTLLTYKMRKEDVTGDDLTPRQTGKVMLLLAAHPLFALALGWIVKQYV